MCLSEWSAILARFSDVHRAYYPRPLRPRKVQSGKCEQLRITHARTLANSYGHMRFAAVACTCVCNKNVRMVSCGGQMRQLAAARDESPLRLVLGLCAMKSWGQQTVYR